MSGRASWGPPRDGPNPTLLGVAAAAGVVTAITLVIYPLRDIEVTPTVSGGILYMLGVLLVATVWGLRLGVLTAIASAAAFDYFHIPVNGQITVTKGSDIVAIAVFLVVGLIASVIADRARMRAVDAEARLRLEEELRRREAERIRLEEVRASRARVLEAADEERRRVVRDLHDGAQQRLVHTVISLKLARDALAKGEEDTDALLRDALEHAERANYELRDLSHGILPRVLTQGGLRNAVDSLAERIPLPVAVDVSVDRLPAPIEATAYFVVAEALTNVVKHSGAESAIVTAFVDDRGLRIEVRDDGVGGASREGSGLIGLVDRLSAHDGELRVESPPGGGTTVVATIPLPDYPAESRR